MKQGQLLAAATVTAVLLPTGPAVASAATAFKVAASVHPRADVPSNDLTQCSAAFFEDDPRLGPDVLPQAGLVGAELFGYQRTGSLTPDAFLALYYDPTANGGAGGWIYPPGNGFVLDSNGQPALSRQTLNVGDRVDLYGSGDSSFLYSGGQAYSARSIPPQDLDGTPPESCNYNEYRVTSAFDVYAGQVVPWFEQPGYGDKYQLDGSLIPGAPASVNVSWLVNNGYLVPIVIGPGQ